MAGGVCADKFVDEIKIVTNKIARLFNEVLKDFIVWICVAIICKKLIICTQIFSFFLTTEAQ